MNGRVFAFFAMGQSLAFSLLLFLSFSFATRGSTAIKEPRSPASSANSQLLSITTDASNEIHYVHVNTDEQGNILHLQVNEKIYGVNMLERLQGEGVGLYNDKKVQIAALYSDDFTFAKGGHIRFEYLDNGIFNRWKALHFYLRKVGGHWHLIYRHSDQRLITVRGLHVITKKIMGIPYGIRRFTINPRSR